MIVLIQESIESNLPTLGIWARLSIFYNLCDATLAVVLPTTDGKVRLSSYTVAHFADEIVRNWINKLTTVASNTLNLRGSHFQHCLVVILNHMLWLVTTHAVGKR